MRIAAIITVVCTASVSSTTDMEHMGRCVPAVRTFVSEPNDSIDWLIHKANEDLDVVLLYMLRMCYFYHERTEQPLDIASLFARIKHSVKSFTEHEFNLLTEVIRTEIETGSLYPDIVDADDALELDVEAVPYDAVLVQLIAILIGVGLPLYVFRRRSKSHPVLVSVQQEKEEKTSPARRVVIRRKD